jgi:hypothetical protein
MNEFKRVCLLTLFSYINVFDSYFLLANLLCAQNDLAEATFSQNFTCFIVVQDS